ncbi:hypothetical protein [Alteribacillus bidgolensis]|uniref:Uncharacterized protein n=1 Tax=Alteribacillus bidgolensis TaxID=930129 RepID=A0A1G8CKV2_9BACI|nr:hypothetical protein [Alteribacillus bidgolensis]SDH45969.1 hypothetical protein SAMN05216352_101355 [Alteribacillus bidgolensis]
MGKKICWIIIFITLAMNVVMLQFTVHSYLGRESNQVYVYSGVAVISGMSTVITYLIWRKKEYNENA